jgi:hypothetical protein
MLATLIIITVLKPTIIDITKSKLNSIFSKGNIEQPEESSMIIVSSSGEEKEV